MPVNGDQVLDELGRELRARRRCQLGSQPGDATGGRSGLGHTGRKAVDQGRIRQKLRVHVAPEGGRDRDYALERAQQLEFAQATRLDDRFGGLHSKDHRRAFEAHSRALPLERERHL